MLISDLNYIKKLAGYVDETNKDNQTDTTKSSRVSRFDIFKIKPYSKPWAGHEIILNENKLEAAYNK